MVTSLALGVLAGLVRAIGARHATPNFDTYGHLLFAKRARAQRTGPVGAIDTGLRGMPPLAVPLLWHWLLGLLPAEFVHRNQRSIGAALEACFVAGAHALCVAGDVPAPTSAFACLLYVFSPMWFSRVAIGPRVNSLTPRLASEIAVNLLFLFALLPLAIPAAVRFAVVAALSVFVLLSTKFGIQALALLVPVTALVQQDLALLAATAAGLAIAVVATRGEVVAALAAQLRHLRWYARENQRGVAQVSDRNSVRVLAEAVRHAHRTRSLSALTPTLLSKNSYTALVLKLPAFVVPGVVALLGLAVGTPPGVSPWGAPVVASALAFVAINHPRLLFLGEAERYINHVALPVALFAATVLSQSGVEPLLYGLLAYGFAYWMWESFLLHRWLPSEREERARHEEATRILDLLRSQAPTTVLCYPFHAIGVWRLLLETDCGTLLPQFMDPADRTRFESTYGAAPYPFINLSRLTELAAAYDITVVVVDRRAWARRGCPGFAVLSTWRRLPRQGSVYDVYARVAPDEAAVASPPAFDVKILSSAADLAQLTPTTPTFVYGAGLAGLTVCQRLEAAGLTVAAFVTTNESGTRHGRPLLTLDAFRQAHARDFQLVIASEAFCEIADTLATRGITDFYNGLPLLDAPIPGARDVRSTSTR